jgi:hypothetical protein
MDTEGRVKLAPRKLYDYTPFKDGKAFVTYDYDTIIGKPIDGILNKNGLIKPIKHSITIYDVDCWAFEAASFSEDRRAVFKIIKDKESGYNRYLGYVDYNGKTIIEPKYDLNFNSDFSDGVAAVCKEKKCGYIDKNNRVVIPFKFSSVYPFSNGYAFASIDSLFGIINKKGEFIVPPKYSEGCCYKFQDGVAIVKNQIIDYFGNVHKILPDSFMLGNKFSEKLISYHVETYEDHLDQYVEKHGFMDIYGNIVIKPIFEQVDWFGFSEGYCAVKYNGKWGYIKNPLKYLVEQPEQPREIVHNGRSEAIFFAVDTYQEDGFYDLKNPIKDSERLASSLKTIFDFDTYIHRNPSKNQIQKVLAEFRDRDFNKDDQLLIHFSGHGAATNKGFFIPADGKYNDEYGNSWYSYAELELDITTIPCPHILLIFDACYSSSFNKEILFGDLYSELKNSNYKRPGELSETQKFIDRCMAFKSRLVIMTGINGTRDNSEFTDLFLEKFGLYNRFGSNAVLDYDELKSHIKKNFPNSDFRTFDLHEEGGNFLFIR